MKMKLLITIVALGLMLTVNVSRVMAFGISPSGIYNDRLMPGSSFEQTFTVSRSSNDTEDLQVIIEPDLSEFSSWFTYEPAQKFDFPGNESEKQIKIKVKVPQDAPLKSYDGFIRIKASTKDKSSGVAIVKGVRMEVNLLTSNLVVSDLLVRSMRFEDVKEGEALNLLLTIENKGNAKVAPTKATVEVLNLNQEPIGTLSTDKADSIEANATKDIVMKFPLTIGLAADEYFGIVKIYLGDKVIRQERLVFRVLEQTKADSTKTGAITKSNANGLLVSFTSKNILIPLFLIVASIAMLIVAVAMKKKVKGKMRLLLYVLAYICLFAAGAMLVMNSINGQSDSQKSENKIVTPASPTMVPPTLPPATETMKQATPSGAVKGAQTKAKTPAAPIQIKDPRGNVFYLYETPDVSARIIYTALQGEKLDVIQEQSNWFYVSASDGTKGWLQKTSVKDQTVVEQ